MFDQVIPVLHSGALLIVVTMTLAWIWSVVSTLQRSRSQMLADMEPVFLWVEIQTINVQFLSYSRNKALFIVFFGLGLLLWLFLAVITVLMHLVSPDLLSFLLNM
jgi:hypothetical protein